MEILNTTNTISLLFERVKDKQEEIHRWLDSHEGAKDLPLYSSVDIRDAGFKVSVVDTNIFPAGFNNLCEHGLKDSESLIRTAINKRAANCKDILIIAEEHTRNAWYLENIRILQQIIERAGFRVRIATFLNVQPAFYETAKCIELETATGALVKIYCVRKVLEEFQAGRERIDLIILNNDLTTGIPEILKNSSVPVYPSLQAGWHSRSKRRHFDYTRDLICEFARILEVDPWLVSCLHNVADKVDINVESDRQKLMDSASDLFNRIRVKYQEHRIGEKPYIFVKADSGTYGMGVLPIEDPHDIMTLNHRNRNKLHMGKNGQLIDRYLLQEGVPTIYNIDQEVSEVCIYQIENNLVGGFYRSHISKGQRDNLNSQGMVFKKMCPHLSKYGDCGVHHDINIFDFYRILARIAGIAAHREIIQLEATLK
ncbi:MAG: glutamate--cysteine ligase [Candidatus Omnitrophica bacterium]|nr:glutamate--cysteine ligase [Candidatus Omnitrophota bacterium]